VRDLFRCDDGQCTYHHLIIVPSPLCQVYVLAEARLLQLYPKVASEKFKQERRDELFQVTTETTHRVHQRFRGVGGVRVPPRLKLSSVGHGPTLHMVLVRDLAGRVPMRWAPRAKHPSTRGKEGFSPP
jgi:hypothetical protein